MGVLGGLDMGFFCSKCVLSRDCFNFNVLNVMVFVGVRSRVIIVLCIGFISLRNVLIFNKVVLKIIYRRVSFETLGALY